LPQCRINNREHTFQIAVDIVVPESQHLEAAAFKTSIAHSIATFVVIEVVLAAIDFNNQAMSHANEIDYRAAAG